MGPLLSQEARKKLAGLKVYQQRLGRARAIKYSKPYQKNPRDPSPGQLDQRMIYNLIIARWQTMTDGEKAPYIAAVEAGRLSMSPWNYFFKEARKDLYTHLGLCGYWSFNQIVNGKTPDLSGNGNDGTPKPSYPDNCPQLVPGLGGKFGQAMSFDGIDDYIDAETSGLNNDFGTVIALIQPDFAWDVGSHHKIWNIYTANHDRVEFYYDFNLDKFSFAHNYISSPTSSLQSFSSGDLLHVAISWSTTRKKIYIKSVLEGTYIGALNVSIPASQYIGVGHWNSTRESYFNGLIIYMLNYNRTLGQPEIQKNYEIYSKYK